MTKKQQVLQLMNTPKVNLMDYKGKKWHLVCREDLEKVFDGATDAGNSIRIMVSSLRAKEELKSELISFDGGYFVEVI